MNLVQQAWEAADTRRMSELLGAYAKDTGSGDLRGFEWYYWSRQARRYTGELEGHTAGIITTAFSPDGRALAASDHAYNLRIWDPERAASRTVAPRPESGVLSLRFSPDGAILAAGCHDGTILIVDPRGGARRQTETPGRRG